MKVLIHLALILKIVLVSAALGFGLGFYLAARADPRPAAFNSCHPTSMAAAPPAGPLAYARRRPPKSGSPLPAG